MDWVPTDDLVQLNELDPMDELVPMNELGPIDKLNPMDELVPMDKLVQMDELDQMDELVQLDELDPDPQVNPPMNWPENQSIDGLIWKSIHLWIDMEINPYMDWY